LYLGLYALAANTSAANTLAWSALIPWPRNVRPSSMHGLTSFDPKALTKRNGPVAFSKWPICNLVAGTGLDPVTFGLCARRAARLLHPASEERIVIRLGRKRKFEKDHQ